MNIDNKFFLELKENKEAGWIVDFLERWERVWNRALLPEMDMSSYMQDSDNMERLTYEAWKHYCQPSRGLKSKSVG